MKIYELVIVKGGFIYDGDSNEQERTDDVEVKLYKTEQERNQAYNNLIDPYIKLREFRKKTRDELFIYPDYNADRDCDLSRELDKKCTEFASKVGCDTNCLDARICRDDIVSYTHIYIEHANPCDTCKEQYYDHDRDICCKCKLYRDDISSNQFYYVFKKETEI